MNTRNIQKQFKLNRITQSFELKMEQFAYKVVMSENAKYNTILQKDYFDNYEIVEMKLTMDWCDIFAPCGNGNQCKLSQYGSRGVTNGFKCLCNPIFNMFGPLCFTPSPCTRGPCKNNGKCTNVYNPDGTADY